VPAADDVVAARTPYPAPFVSEVSVGNIFAVQFHPEKSHSAGLRMLANFMAWNVGARDPGLQDHHAAGAS
jgi:glutamine amidotransferase